MLISGRLPRLNKGGLIADSIIGAIGGLMSGIGGFSGVVPTLWCVIRGFDKDTQRIIIQNFNLTILAGTMIVYIKAGIVTISMIPTFSIVAIAMMIPTLIGARLYIGISEATFRKIILTLLTVSGITLLYSGILSVT